MYILLSEGHKSLLQVIHKQSFVKCFVAQVFLIDSTPYLLNYKLGIFHHPH
jgi:hypothetical protein